MSGRRDGLLADIEAGILDDTPLSRLLQKCIILGAHSGSEKLRDWARAELNGYVGADIPDYRKVGAPLFAHITNLAGFHGFPQRIYTTDLSKRVHDFLDEHEINWEVVPFDQGIGDLEATVAAGRDEPVRLCPSWTAHMVRVLNAENAAPNTRVETLYWELPTSSVHGVLVRIRTVLADLVAELVTRTPEGQDVPAKGAADQAIQFVINGNSVINYSPQQAGDGGTTSVVVGAPKDEPKPEGWFKRWRKRGIIVGIATVVAAVVGVATWLDWTPW